MERKVFKSEFFFTTFQFNSNAILLMEQKEDKVAHFADKLFFPVNLLLFHGKLEIGIGNENNIF